MGNFFALVFFAAKGHHPETIVVEPRGTANSPRLPVDYYDLRLRSVVALVGLVVLQDAQLLVVHVRL